jgi:hypothetical protein
MSYQRTNYRSPYQTCTGSTPVSTTQTVYSYITPTPRSYASFWYNGPSSAGFQEFASQRQLPNGQTLTLPAKDITLDTPGQIITFLKKGVYQISLITACKPSNDTRTYDPIPQISLYLNTTTININNALTMFPQFATHPNGNNTNMNHCNTGTFIFSFNANDYIVLHSSNTQPDAHIGGTLSIIQVD